MQRTTAKQQQPNVGIYKSCNKTVCVYRVQSWDNPNNIIYTYKFIKPKKEEKNEMKKQKKHSDNKTQYISEEYKNCNFLKEIKVRNKYVYYKCNLTSDGQCICQYRKCTLFVDKETYKKNAKKYPLNKEYQCSKPMHN